MLDRVKIVSNKKLTDEVYLMISVSPELTRTARPGQFVHVRCGTGKDYLLRRPLSIHRVYDDFFELLYKVVGQGTSDLSRLGPGDEIDLIGPLGKGFDLKEASGRSLIVAGGVGIAPLMFLIDQLREERAELSVVLGVRLRDELLYHDELSRTVENIFVSVDEDSAGNVGNVIELLAEVMEFIQPRQVFACGPEEMLKKAASLTAGKAVPCQVSLERQMGCGIGACMACVVRTNTGYQRVCKDGPVFDAGEIVW